MHNATPPTIAVIFLSGVGFLFLGIFLAPMIENINSTNIFILSIVFIGVSIGVAVYAQKQAKGQIYDATGTTEVGKGF
jgi:hypothetical protein